MKLIFDKLFIYPATSSNWCYLYDHIAAVIIAGAAKLILVVARSKSRARVRFSNHGDELRACVCDSDRAESSVLRSRKVSKQGPLGSLSSVDNASSDLYAFRLGLGLEAQTQRLYCLEALLTLKDSKASLKALRSGSSSPLEAKLHLRMSWVLRALAQFTRLTSACAVGIEILADT